LHRSPLTQAPRTLRWPNNKIRIGKASQVDEVDFSAELRGKGAAGSDRNRARRARLAPTSRPQFLGALSPRESDLLQLITHGLSTRKSPGTSISVQRRLNRISRASSRSSVSRGAPKRCRARRRLVSSSPNEPNICFCCRYVDLTGPLVRVASWPGFGQRLA
jgi:hypothetical protein